MACWESELDRLQAPHPPDPDLQTDITLLRNLLLSLREQLSEVRAWESQPTFYLTLASLGMAEAMESDDQEAKHRRAGGLAAFFEMAARNLVRVPTLFRDLALEMLPGTRRHLAAMAGHAPELGAAVSSLDRFGDAIRKVLPRKNFHLPLDLVERIIGRHLGCGMGVREADGALDREIAAMRGVLREESRRLAPDMSGALEAGEEWPEAFRRMPVPPLGREGVTGLYKGAVEGLAGHCLERGLVSPDLLSSCPVRVSPVPPHLSAVRSASSYSIPPLHPPRGGRFYVMVHEAGGGKPFEPLREYRMLAAHETYPGHHLLDCSRWRLERRLRRVIERPLFYEGWACFSEELMGFTGYFSGPSDRLLLAKRRLWRAVRGKVSMGLEAGTMDIRAAAEHLTRAGVGREQALSVVRKYPLQPGYRVCYTVGLQKFLGLFNKYGLDNVGHFVRTAMGHGEIPFPELEAKLRNINN